MPTIPVQDPIDFLVARKFPDLRRRADVIAIKYGVNNGIVYDPDDEIPDVISEEVIKNAAIYREKLASLSRAEIKQLYQEELSKQHLEDDQRRFFNQPHAEADFDYWAKIPGWKVDEAVALTLGKNPKIVNTEKLEVILSYTSPFVQQYHRIKELVSRSRSAGLLTDSLIVTSTDHIIPHKFVRWAQNSEIDFPAKLAEKVIRFYEANKPPKTAFEKSIERLQEMPAIHNANFFKQNVETAPKQKSDEKDEKSMLAKERAAYSNIIGALLGTLLGKSPSGKPYSQFDSQQSIIDSIHANYGSKLGLSKRNLEAKFAEAQKSLKSSLLDD